MECYTYLRNVTDLLADGKTPCERRFGQPFKGPIIPFGSLVEYHPITAKDQSRIHQFGKKVLPGIVPRMTMDASENLLKKTQCERGDISQRKWRIYFPAADGRIKPPGEDQEVRTPTRNTGAPNSRRRSQRFSWRIKRVSSTTSRLVSGCR